MKDPRPDLNGTEIWEKLFELAEGELLGSLKGIRCFGTVLKKTKSGWRFIPIVSDGNWQSKEEFKEIMNQYLGDYRKEIAELLKKL